MQHLASTTGNKKEAIENRSGIDKESFSVRLSLVYLFIYLPFMYQYCQQLIDC
jgi:hypothetical protein